MKYLIGSSSVIAFPSITLIPLLFFITSLDMAPLLTSLFYFFVLSFAFGRCFRTLAVVTSQFFSLFLFLLAPAPTNLVLFKFQKVRWLSTSIPTIFLFQNTPFSSLHFLYLFSTKVLPNLLFHLA